MGLIDSPAYVIPPTTSRSRDEDELAVGLPPTSNADRVLQEQAMPGDLDYPPEFQAIETQNTMDSEQPRPPSPEESSSISTDEPSLSEDSSSMRSLQTASTK